MVKGIRPKNLSGLLIAMILATDAFLCVAALVGSGLRDSPRRSAGQYGQYATLLPNEVILYEHANFVGSYLRYKLEPGMRQLLVPVIPESMNDKISSIQVGSEVGVMVFEHAGFRDQGISGILYNYKPLFLAFNDTQKVLLDNTANDSISSLIVFQKGQEVTGAMLYDNAWDQTYTQFFPLPELENETEAKYSGLGPMNDDANEVVLFPRDQKSPGYGKVRVTMYEHPDFAGRWITLPGADGSIPPKGIFTMNTYQFDDTASSLIVRWTGPPPLSQLQVSLVTLPSPSTKARVAAPPATDTMQASPGSEAAKTAPDQKAPLPPDAKVIATDISGQWNSNIGAVYEIQQSGNNFTWSVPSLNQSGTGTVSGNIVTMSGPGWTVKGMITDTDTSGRPTKIIGENGVVLFRTTEGQPAAIKPPAQQPAPPAPSVPPSALNTLTGQWNSNIGVVYEIQQTGNQFTWSVPSLNQSGTGTVAGNIVTMSGPGWTVKGIITEADSSGRPTKIVGENGVILFRTT
jgi:Beta/Gamma crystallin